MARILAVDPGTRRMGLAVADAAVRLARPLAVLERRSRAEDFARLVALAREQGADLIVVGQPLAPDGGEGVRARTVARWAAALADVLPEGVRVVLWNERGSTVAAAAIQQAQGGRGSKRRTPLDAVAAAVILQDYLDAQPPG